MKRLKNLGVGLIVAGAFVLSAIGAQAADRNRAYSYSHFTSVTPHDTNITIKGARWIQVTVAGNVTFLHRDATASPAYPMTAYSTFELGYQHIGVKSTGTTATGIFAFWDIDVPSGPLP